MKLYIERYDDRKTVAGILIDNKYTIKTIWSKATSTENEHAIGIEILNERSESDG